MKNYKVILLLDMDSFFASCHVTVDPSLKGKPIVVSTPNKRAVVSSCSYEARAMGIKAGTPLFKVEAQHKGIIKVKSDYKLYSKLSYMVFEAIKKKITNKIEVASIDECYIDITNEWKKYGSVKRTCAKIQKLVYETTKLTCSIGASYNKFLAKMACPLNKPNGITIIKGDDYKKMLWNLDISKMFGVGKSTEEKLRPLGINTIGDLANYDREKFIDIFKKRGFTLHQQANGIGSENIEWKVSNNKSLSNELTLDDDINDFNQLKNILYSLTRKTWERLVLRNMEVENIGIHLTNRIKNGEPYNKKASNITRSKSITLKEPTVNLDLIFSHIMDLFSLLFENDDIHKIGISFDGINEINNKTFQATLDTIKDNNDNQKKSGAELVNVLNKKLNTSKLRTADKINRNKQFQSKIFQQENRHLSHQEIKENQKNKK